MRKILPLLLCLLALASTIEGCTSTSSNSGIDLTSPKVQGIIQIARTVGRSAITIYLGSKHVDPADTLLIFAEIDPMIDDLVAGNGVKLVFDQAAWGPARAKLVSRLSKAITAHAKVKGVAVVDQGTADLLAAQAVDAAADTIRRYVTPPATSTSGS